jgi:hypothetical protein
MPRRISQAPGLRPDGTLESRRALLVRHRRSNPLVKNKEHRIKHKSWAALLLFSVLCSLFWAGAALRFADRDQACWPDPVRVFDLRIYSAGFAIARILTT